MTDQPIINITVQSAPINETDILIINMPENIGDFQRDRHIEHVKNFFKKYRPGIICLFPPPGHSIQFVKNKHPDLTKEELTTLISSFDVIEQEWGGLDADEQALYDRYEKELEALNSET